MREVAVLDRPHVLVDFLTLAKPELTFLSMLTSVAGFLLGTAGPVNAVTLTALLIGTALVGGGAGALNQYLERDLDGLMRRTMHRPLPSGRLSSGTVLGAGGLMSIAGVLVLLTGTNALTAVLAACTLALYLLAYTPMKRISLAATFVGAIPGALPPLIGWTAATNGFGTPGWLLFVVLFLWQLPHFWSLASLYRKDYARAGYRLLPVMDPTGRTTGLAILASCLGLTLLPLGLVEPAGLGGPSIFGTVGAGIIFTAIAAGHLRSLTSASARRVFVASLFYLPPVLLIYVLDRFL